MTATSFTQRHNAKRAAERMITVGIAPSIDYGLRENDEGRYEIVWKTTTPVAPAVEAEEDGTENDADRGPEDVAEPDEEFSPEPEITGPDLWPLGSRVKILRSPGSLTGTVVERYSTTHWSVHLDFTSPVVIQLFAGEEMVSEAATAAPRAIVPPREAKEPKTDKAPRAPNAAIAALTASGKMPEKPIITSKTNAGYQKRFDKVEALAAVGDWDGVREYAVNGVNSYAQMLRGYRDRMLAAHAASISSRAA